MKPRLWTVVALAAAVAVPAMANGITVSGTVRGGKGMKISAIGLDGTATTGTITSNGSFRLSVPSSRAKTATLHLITSNGDYYGPVILARKGSVGYTRLNNTTVNLGAVTKKAGYAFVATTPAKGTYGTRAGTVKVTKAWAPMGAGKLGLVKVASSAAEMSRKGEHQSGGGNGSGGGQQGGGSQYSPTDPCGTAVGGDCDKDGVPNAFDVDDNGNLTIDMTDAVSVQSTAKLLTYSDVRPSISNTVNANAGATPDQINAFLGSNSTSTPTGLQLAFYYGSEDLVGTQSRGTLQRVWVSCQTGASWCAPGSPTATVSGYSEYPQILPDAAAFGSVSWFAFTGSTCAMQGQPCQPTSTPAPGNGFQASSAPGAPAGAVWTAFVKPNAADTLGTVNADSVLTLNYDGSGIAQSQKPIGISPYFVTTPAITNVTTASGSTALSYPYPANGPGTSSGTAFQIGTDGNLGLTLWRPQRLALPGEAGQFYDVGGLHYGLSLDSVRLAGNPNGEQRPSQEAGCGLTAGAGLTPNNPSLGGRQTGLWDSIAPLQDTIATDQQPNPANTVSFSANVLQCAQSAFPTSNLAGASANLSLMAIGQPLSHGANRTGVSFTVKLPGSPS